MGPNETTALTTDLSVYEPDLPPSVIDKEKYMDWLLKMAKAAEKRSAATKKKPLNSKARKNVRNRKKKAKRINRKK